MMATDAINMTITHTINNTGIAIGSTSSMANANTTNDTTNAQPPATVAAFVPTPAGATSVPPDAPSDLHRNRQPLHSLCSLRGRVSHL